MSRIEFTIAVNADDKALSFLRKLFDIRTCCEKHKHVPDIMILYGLALLQMGEQANEILSRDVIGIGLGPDCPLGAQMEITNGGKVEVTATLPDKFDTLQ